MVFKQPYKNLVLWSHGSLENGIWAVRRQRSAHIFNTIREAVIPVVLNEIILSF